MISPKDDTEAAELWFTTDGMVLAREILVLRQKIKSLQSLNEIFEYSGFPEEFYNGYTFALIKIKEILNDKEES